MWSHYPSPQSSSSVASPLLTSAEGTVQHPLRGFPFGLQPTFLPSSLVVHGGYGKKTMRTFWINFYISQIIKKWKVSQGNRNFSNFPSQSLQLRPPSVPFSAASSAISFFSTFSAPSRAPHKGNESANLRTVPTDCTEDCLRTKGTFLPRFFQTHGPHICYPRCSWDMGTV